jgi:ankyrin repeat protein
MRTAAAAILALAVLFFVAKEEGWFIPLVRIVGAAEQGDLEAVKALIKQGRSINERESKAKFGWTPLIAAIYQGHTNVVRYLLDAGADPNLGGKNGETPLMWATAKGDDNIEIVEALLSHGARVRLANSNGATALDYAASDPPTPKTIEVLRAADAGQSKDRKR